MEVIVIMKDNVFYSSEEYFDCLFKKIHDKLGYIYQGMESEIPFTKPYENLNERKNKLLNALRILKSEGLI